MEGEGGEADGVDSLAKGGSLLLATDRGRVVGTVIVEGKGSSGSTVEQGSGPGVLDPSLSTGASDCTSPGEEDFATFGSRFGVSSRRKSGELHFGPLHTCLNLQLLKPCKVLMCYGIQLNKNKTLQQKDKCN